MNLPFASGQGDTRLFTAGYTNTWRAAKNLEDVIRTVLFLGDLCRQGCRRTCTPADMIGDWVKPPVSLSSVPPCRFTNSLSCLLPSTSADLLFPTPAGIPWGNGGRRALVPRDLPG